MAAEFHWHAAQLLTAAGLSLVLSGICIPVLRPVARRFGVRATTLTGCLASGLLLLLMLPNLTHLWQVCLLLLALGFTRALAFSGAWHMLRLALGTALSLSVLAACVLIGAIVVTPWVAQIVYRNSWREGAAACAGLMIVLASPLAYLLLPGAEVEPNDKGTGGKAV